MQKGNERMSRVGWMDGWMDGETKLVVESKEHLTYVQNLK